MTTLPVTRIPVGLSMPERTALLIARGLFAFISVSARRRDARLARRELYRAQDAAVAARRRAEALGAIGILPR